MLKIIVGMEIWIVASSDATLPCVSYTHCVSYLVTRHYLVCVAPYVAALFVFSAVFIVLVQL